MFRGKPSESAKKNEKNYLLRSVAGKKTCHNRKQILIKYLHPAMLSGRVFSLFPDTLRTFRLSNNPIESGRYSSRLEETSSTSSSFNPAIESGMTCFAHYKPDVLRNNIKEFNTHPP